MMNSPDCDWRINPFMVLPTNPPRRQIVCADCGETSFIDESDYPDSSYDPKTWPRLNK